MNKSYNLLVVGVGSIGERHVRCFQSTGRVRVAICEVNPQLARTIADRYGIESVFESFDDALAAGPEAVLIATPAHLHVAMAQKAVRAGIHTLIEKPLSTRFEGVGELISTAQQTNVTIGVAYVLRSHPALAAMRNAIRSGRFGEPVQIVATCGQNFPHFRPAYRTIYYRDRATGGGAVQDALTHIIDAGQWLVGPIDRLVADIDHQVLEGVSVEDTAHVVARHGRVMGCYSLNQFQAPDEVTLTVHGTGGTARFEGHHARWRWMIEPAGTWHDEDHGPLQRDTLFVRQAQAFLDAIDTRSPMPCSLSEGLQTLRANLAILESVQRAGWQTIPTSTG